MPERVNYVSVPIELIACPFFSEKDKQIISDIIRLSDKYIDLGGCNLTNNQLAFKHRTGKQTVSNAISKAGKLGFVLNRQDVIHIAEQNYRIERRLQMSIPQEWQYMGDLYNHAFIRGNKESLKLFRTIEARLKEIPVNKINKEDVAFLINVLINKDPHINYFLETPIKKVVALYNKEENIINKGGKKTSSSRKRISPGLIKNIVSEWNRLATDSDIPAIRKLTPERSKKLKTRITNFKMTTLTDWKDLFFKVQQSSFLNGQNNRSWIITFDWLIASDKNFTKVLENNYKTRKGNGQIGKKQHYHDDDIVYDNQTGKLTYPEKP